MSYLPTNMWQMQQQQIEYNRDYDRTYGQHQENHLNLSNNMDGARSASAPTQPHNFLADANATQSSAFSSSSQGSSACPSYSSSPSSQDNQSGSQMMSFEIQSGSGPIVRGSVNEDIGMEDLSQQLCSMNFDSQTVAHQKVPLAAAAPQAQGGDNSIDVDDDALDYFQQDYQSHVRRTNPVYASMASHHHMGIPDQNPIGSGIMKKTDLYPICNARYF